MGTADAVALPAVAAERKALPVASGFVDYFPDAIVAVAELSRIGNDQHNPGKPLHWDRSKSGDEGDALFRHFIDRGKLDTDGVRHSTKVAWRAMALLQKELEAAAGAVGVVSDYPKVKLRIAGAGGGPGGGTGVCADIGSSGRPQP